MSEMEDELLREAKMVLSSKFDHRISQFRMTSTQDVVEAIEAMIDVKLAIMMEQIADRLESLPKPSTTP